MLHQVDVELEGEARRLLGGSLTRYVHIPILTLTFGYRFF